MQQRDGLLDHLAVDAQPGTMLGARRAITGMILGLADLPAVLVMVIVAVGVGRVRAQARPSASTYSASMVRPRSRCRTRPYCAGPCWRGWAPRMRRGWTRTGSWRCSPAHCGISVNAAAWHKRHRDQRPGQELPPHLGAARVRARSADRTRGRPAPRGAPDGWFPAPPTSTPGPRSHEATKRDEGV